MDQNFLGEARLDGQGLFIKNGDITIHSLTEKDVSNVYLSWMNDPEILRYISSRNKINSRENIKKYVAKFDNVSSFHLGIFVCDNSKHVGNISVHCDVNNKVASTGVLIGDKALWGSDIVVRSRFLILQFLFEKMDIFKVTGTPLATNLSAIFNYKKQGFVVEGIQKDHVMLSDGTRTDVIHFAIFREAYDRLASGYSLANEG